MSSTPPIVSYSCTVCTAPTRRYPGRRLCDYCYKALHHKDALPPRIPKSGTSRRKPKPKSNFKSDDDFSARYGVSEDLICPRCEIRPVYIRRNGKYIAPADCCLPCRRAEQALADYWRLPDVDLPLAQHNENMRLRLTPKRKRHDSTLGPRD